MKTARILLTLLLVLLFLPSCRTTGESSATTSHTVRTDTMRFFTHTADTLRQRDSIYVVERTLGETIRIEQHHFHTLERTKVLRDTIFSVRTDTLRTTVTKEKRTKVSGGGWLAAACCGLVLLAAFILNKSSRRGE